MTGTPRPWVWANESPILGAMTNLSIRCYSVPKEWGGTLRHILFRRDFIRESLNSPVSQETRRTRDTRNKTKKHERVPTPTTRRPAGMDDVRWIRGQRSEVVPTPRLWERLCVRKR